jgi:chromate reductase
MTNETTILGISGSLRRGSHNTRLLGVAAQEAPAGMTVEIADISGLPLYNFDLETHDDARYPKVVRHFREQIAAADGLLFATPEYNWSLSGVLKNAIDWASRPETPLRNKPAAIISGGGRFGGVRSQEHLRDILRHFQMKVVDTPEVMVPLVDRSFDADGNFDNDRALDQMQRAMANLAALVQGS